MTTNKYATLRGTIGRAKRHDCQKVVMRVTLAEELLDQLSKADERIAELEAVLACDRCGTICTRPDGAHYCHVSDNADSRYRPPVNQKAKN
ncbi:MULTISPECIES: hypothetical protein [Enterobacter cloacae complex]|uniref:hypothetical protein n=1 Tax=Enterobacter cloacae complex TaxID=354276 RepID=UPI0005F910AA|nr:hypothetical protein [Enterobacter hormaechei]ELJ5806137.1 hypothetical protein [Enterobacter hormaechei]KJX16113.1 hypothetical protein SG82_19255 [Enterobacter hormaechei subsp. xiangfangensis]MBE9457671.1 hypothetical protein [Enterobacter hormaechei]MBF1967305.1 hypothetical protein [Enterobacter hormaechei]MCM7435407.1 hypothetical protein [Enterobacter hormaechei]